MRFIHYSIVLSVLVILCQGCANPYSQYYIDLTHGDDITKVPFLDNSVSEPKISLDSTLVPY